MSAAASCFQSRWPPTYGWRSLSPRSGDLPRCGDREVISDEVGSIGDLARLTRRVQNRLRSSPLR
jgi:hypothetical protein